MRHKFDFIALLSYIFTVLKVNTYFMNKFLVLLSIVSLFFMNSCVMHRTAGNSGKVPPGQAKKAYGTQSAKPFAPGQQKKR